MNREAMPVGAATVSYRSRQARLQWSMPFEGIVMGTLKRGLVLGNFGRGPELAAYIAAMDKLRRLGETPWKFLRKQLSNI